MNLDELEGPLLDAWSRLSETARGFVRFREMGYAPMEAYRLAGGQAQTSRAAQSSISALTRSAEYAEFQRLLGRAAVHDLVMSRAEMQVRLTNIARAQTTDVVRLVRRFAGFDKDGNEQWETVPEMTAFEDLPEETLAGVSEVVRKEHGVHVKMHSPLLAMKQLAESAGYSDPTHDGALSGANALRDENIDAVAAAQAYQDLMG